MEFSGVVHRVLVVAAALVVALAACSDDSGSGAKSGADAAAQTDSGGATDGSVARPASDGASASLDAAPAYPPVVCSGAIGKTTAITPALGRKVYCAIDLGSNSVKLQVISLEEGKPLSFKDERQCRTRLGFGAKVNNPMTSVKGPLPDQDIKNLIEVMNEFKAICALDRGALMGTEATQWARWATNMDAVKSQVMAGTGQSIEVLSGEEEGQYGYVAATRNSPERVSLDPGSNSFQIGWWPRGAPGARVTSVELGYVVAANRHYPVDAVDTYVAAAARHTAEIRTALNEALSTLKPATDLAALKKAIASGDLKPELFIIGQDGALQMSLRGELKDAKGNWISGMADYTAKVASNLPRLDMTLGYEITAILTPAEITKWFTDIIKPDDFKALRTNPIRDLYGAKALANTVLLDTLIRELGLTTIVLVPQEMPVGYILAKIK